LPRKIGIRKSQNENIIWLILCLIWGTTWFFIKVGTGRFTADNFRCRSIRSRRFILSVVIFLQKIPLPSTVANGKLMR
jgi:hypothetical protein